ncbi:uncharacterized protein [Embiotoca jacksoni]|uniref:uncharacterized protein n=1 Tax=Embiotoca jacksoni TaxID=100190 RepID=UPI0037045DF5
MDHLTFKYMEMCKVESSTDSDSEISPRWSDTSTMGCVSSAPESGTSQRPLLLTHKPAGRHCCYSLFLDPYDGSSEDSDESHVDVGVSGRQTRPQGKCGGGGCRLSGRSRRLILHHPASVALREVVKNGKRDSVMKQQHLLDVEMKCKSGSDIDTLSSHSDRGGCVNHAERRVTDLTAHTQTMDMELQLDDSRLDVTSSITPRTPGLLTPVEGSSSRMLDSSSERSPGSRSLRPYYKRKLSLPGPEVVELRQRKRQCVVNMEDEQEEKTPSHVRAI